VTVPVWRVATAWAIGERPRGSYALQVGLLWNVLRFHDQGSITEHVDRAAGTYEITIVGDGTSSITTRIETKGVRHGDRWAPVRTRSRFVVRGRESRVDVSYDYERGTIAFRARSETFFLGRERLVDDTVRLPRGLRVDDILSALLNYREGLWQPDGKGLYRTYIVRRERKTDEQPDDVNPDGYRAELVPFEFKIDGAAASFDLTRFSSWATEGVPGRVVFGPDRRPVEVSASLMLGTRLTIKFAPTPAPGVG
jgi:hypothetical protein